MDDPIKMIYIFAEVDYKGKVNFSEGEIEEYSEHLFDGNIENYVRTGFCGNYFDCQIYLPINSTDEFRDKIKNDIIQEFARRCFDKIEKYQDILGHLDDF